LKSVIVIGGGLAGLSSGVALAEAGFRVRIFERRPHLGGRATSYDLPDGTHVDNCQHVTLGCCTNLNQFFGRTGAAGNIRWFDRLYFLDRAGRRSTIEASPLPAPLHLAPSFALFPSLTWAEKRAIARAMLRIVRHGGPPPDAAGATMLGWLRRLRQPEGAIRRFWQVVLVSALNEELDRADARYGADVFWKAFLANRSGFRMGVPAVPLAELYRGCRRAVERQGGEVRTRAAVRGVRFADGRIAGVQLDGGEETAADFYVFAVPHEVLLALLPEEVVQRTPELCRLRHLAVSPITGVHLIYDRPVMREPFLALLDRTVQWVFNKTQLYGRQPASTVDGEQYLQLVSSASYALLNRSRQDIIELCCAELAQALPATRQAHLLKATVVKEAAATFSPTPDANRLRPGPQIGVHNLFLAGDWTATGWPGTMEGAVRSGYRAAEAILALCGHARKLLQPDLPADGLAAFLSRRRFRES
jgi:zeta-carotene desaturase